MLNLLTYIQVVVLNGCLIGLTRLLLVISAILVHQLYPLTDSLTIHFMFVHWVNLMLNYEIMLVLSSSDSDLLIILDFRLTKSLGMKKALYPVLSHCYLGGMCSLYPPIR